MLRSILGLGLLLGVCGLSYTLADDAKKGEGGWVQLFNGKDLSGWKTRPEQPGTWEVKDGILIGRERQSYLFSDRGDYGNFHLRAEVKINLGGDSGILFRAPFQLRRGRTATEFGIPGCYEAELQQNRTYRRPTGSISEATRRKLAVKGFASTAHYDTAIHAYLKEQAK